MRSTRHYRSPVASSLPIIIVLWTFFLDLSSLAFPLGIYKSTYPSLENSPILDDLGFSEPLRATRDLLRQPLKISRDGTAQNDIPTVPGIDEMRTKIKDWGVVESLPDLFYTQYPVSAAEARNWGKENFDEIADAAQKVAWKFAMWGRLVDPSWIVAVSDTYQGYMEDSGFSQARMDYYSDIFLKNMSQAFAEEAHGDVYLLIDDLVYPEGNWNTASAWGGNESSPFPGED